MAQKSTAPTSVLLLLVVGLAAAVIAMQWMAPPQGGVPLPAPLATANVAGWVNTPEPLTADALKGKWVVVDAWAPWCGPCMASMPALAEFRSRWPSDKVMVVGISDNSALSEVQDAIDDIPGFNWPVAYGGSNAQMALGVRGIPTLILFDPAGKEVARASGMGEGGVTSIERLEKVIVDSGQ